MKKLLITLLLATTSLLAQPTNYPGSGTAADPWQVSTVAQFDSLRYNNETEGAGTTWWWKIMNDIDFVDVTYWKPISGGASPTNTWNGSIDGNGKTLKNLTIDTTVVAGADRYVGLFANLGAADAGQIDDGIKILHNIIIDNFHINIDGAMSGWDMNFGILAGKSAGEIGATDVELDSITILNSSLNVELPTTTIGSAVLRIGGMSGWTYRAHHLYIDVDINVTTLSINPRVTGEGLGGITGTTQDDIKYAAFVGRIDVTSEGLPVGGLIGFPDPAATVDSLVDCYVRSTKIKGIYYTGGLIGMNESQPNTRVRNCYVQIDTLHSANDNDTNDLDGHLIGYTEATGPVWTSNYADTQAVLYDFVWDGISEYSTYDRTLRSLNEVTSNGTETAKTTAEMGDVETYVDWDFTNTWEMGEDGYPTLQWIVLFPPGPTLDYPRDAGLVFRADSTILIEWTAGLDTPLTTSYLHYSANGGVDWILIDNLDSLDVDYSWTIPDNPTLQGKVRIVEEGVMVIQQDSSTDNFTILAESSLDIFYPIEKENQIIVIGDTLYINIESTFVNNIWLYWSNDSTAWNFMDSTIVDTVNGFLFDTTTYIWTFDETVSGPEVWVRVNEQDDTTLYSFSKDFMDLGVRYPRGIWVCQADSGGTLIEWFVYYDVSCGWSSPPHTYYNSRIGNLGESYDVISNVYEWPYEDTEFPRSTPVYLITGSDTVEVYLNQFYSQYGATVTYKNRFYYVADKILYCNDLVNGIDSIVVSDLSDQYSGTYNWTEGQEILQVYHVQRSKVSGQYLASNTVFETLNDAWFDPLILINNGTTYPARTITVEALDYPANDNPAKDTQKVLTGSLFQRYHFRGIHPKIRKD